MQFNKIPTTRYALQRKRWGHDFTRNREGSYSKPQANNIKPNVDERTHKFSNTIFVLCTQSFNSYRSWLRQLMSWVGRGVKFDAVPKKTCRLGEPVFFLMGKVITQGMCACVHSFLIH